MKELDKLKEEIAKISHDKEIPYLQDLGVAFAVDKALKLISSLETDKPVEGELLPCPCGKVPTDLCHSSRVDPESLKVDFTKT